MADFDRSVLQFKPNLLMDEATAREVIERLDRAIPMAEQLVDHLPDM